LSRHRLFAMEYVYDFNATRAYGIAYPEAEYESCMVAGSGLLRNIKIKDYIKEYQSQTAELAGISRLRIAREYAKIAFSSIANLHDTWITRRELEDLSPNEKACISEITARVIKRNMGSNEDPVIVAVEEIKIKLFDKMKALDSLTRFFGYNEPEKIVGEINHNITINEIKTDGLSKPAQALLLEISQKQLIDGITVN
ncbi:hypothetical protein LCGC14_1201120, partial [marine sediment metagenome]